VTLQAEMAKPRKAKAVPELGPSLVFFGRLRVSPREVQIDVAPGRVPPGPQTAVWQRTHEIVGITHEAVAGVVELPVEAVESNVGQQGGYDPLPEACRPWVGWNTSSSITPALRNRSTQVENVAVGPLPRPRRP